MAKLKTKQNALKRMMTPEQSHTADNLCNCYVNCSFSPTPLVEKYAQYYE